MAVLMRLLDDPFEQVYEQTTTDCMRVRSVRHEHYNNCTYLIRLPTLYIYSHFTLTPALK